MRAAAFLIIGSLAMPAAAGSGKVKVGEMAPDFTLTLVDKSKVSLSDLRGQVIVINFWATWCVPCRTELPMLDAYYETQKSRGLRVFAVTTEDSLPQYQLKKLFAAMHITPVNKIKGPYYDMDAVPTNIVIGRDGRVRYAKATALTLETLNQIMEPLLKEPLPAS